MVQVVPKTVAIVPDAHAPAVLALADPAAKDPSAKHARKAQLRIDVAEEPK